MEYSNLICVMFLGIGVNVFTFYVSTSFVYVYMCFFDSEQTVVVFVRMLEFRSLAEAMDGHISALV